MVKKASLFMAFFKVGLIGFGGGSALIPIIEKEIVDTRRWLRFDEYVKHTVISNITPGALPVKLGALAGFQLGGCSGSLIAAYAVTLPGVFMTMLILSFFTRAGDRAVELIERFSVGVAIFIIYLLLHFVFRTVKVKDSPGQSKINLLICLAVFAVTGGQESRHFMSLLLQRPEISELKIILGVATIDLIILALFLILFLSYYRQPAAVTAAGIVTFLFLLVRGHVSLLPPAFYYVLLTIMSVMLSLIVVRFLRKRRQSIKLENVSRVIYTMLLFFALPVILIIFTYFVMSGQNTDQSSAGFLSSVAISTLTSFGGGEAYVTVADGIFVGGGYISAEVFFRQIVAVANALPGPILVKIAAGIGLLFAGDNNFLNGWLIGLTALTIAVAVCSVIALFVLVAFDAVRHSSAVVNLRVYIMPVICGLLITTSLALTIEIIKLTSQAGLSPTISLLAIIAGTSCLFGVKHRYDRIPDVLLLLLYAGLGYTWLHFTAV